MGKIIIPPLRFILVFIVSILVFLSFSLIYNWGQWVSVSLTLKNSLLIFIPTAAYEVIIPSITSGLLFTFFSYRKSKVHPIAAVLLSLTVFVIIFFGFKLSSTMMENPDEISFQPFNERKLHSIQSGIIYTDEIIDETGIKNILIRNKDSEIPGFKFYDRGKIIKGEYSELELGGQRSLIINPHNPVFHETLLPGRLLRSFLTDIHFLNETFRDAARENENDFILLTAALTAFLMACFLFRGATVWPLFDFFLILSFHRISYYLLTLLSKEADFISETLFGAQLPENIALVSLGAITLLIFLIGALVRLTTRRPRV